MDSYIQIIPFGTFADIQIIRIDPKQDKTCPNRIHWDEYKCSNKLLLNKELPVAAWRKAPKWKELAELPRFKSMNDIR